MVAAENAPVTPTRRRAGTSPAAWTILLLTIILGCGGDLLSKHLAFDNVGDAPVVLNRDALMADPEFDPTITIRPIRFGPGDVFAWRLVLNRGAVFGIGAHQRAVLIGFTLLAMGIGLWIFAWRTRPGQHIAHIGLGLIFAGGLGNLYDRVCFGVVRDFMQLLPGRHLPGDRTWPGGNPELLPWVFNVADLCLLAGAILVLMVLYRRRAAR